MQDSKRDIDIKNRLLDSVRESEMGWLERIALKHVYYHMWNRSPVQVWCIVRKHLTGGFLCAVLELSGILSVQFSSVTQSHPTLWDPMNRSMPGLPVHHQLLEFTQTHAHRVGDAIQSSHPLSSPSPVPNPSQHQGLFQWVSSSHQVAKELEFQPQHQSF